MLPEVDGKNLNLMFFVSDSSLYFFKMLVIDSYFFNEPVNVWEKNASYIRAYNEVKHKSC